MRLITLLLLGTFGCSDEKMALAEMGTETPSDDSLDTGELDRDDANAPAEEASHWLLSGSLTHTSGELSSEMSSLTIEILSESGTVLCSDGVGISASERATELPDPDLQVWWEIRVAAAREGSCLEGELEGVIGGLMWVGLGPLHPEIEAVMNDSIQELESGDFELRSVFASFEETQPVWVFGLAVASATDRVVGEGTGLILPDGQWKFEGVYAFPY
jgi:hypothetical protein